MNLLTGLFEGLKESVPGQVFYQKHAAEDIMKNQVSVARKNQRRLGNAVIVKSPTGPAVCGKKMSPLSVNSQ